MNSTAWRRKMLYMPRHRWTCGGRYSAGGTFILWAWEMLCWRRLRLLGLGLGCVAIMSSWWAAKCSRMVWAAPPSTVLVLESRQDFVAEPVVLMADMVVMEVLSLRMRPKSLSARPTFRSLITLERKPGMKVQAVEMVRPGQTSETLAAAEAASYGSPRPTPPTCATHLWRLTGCGVLSTTTTNLDLVVELVGQSSCPRSISGVTITHTSQ